MKSIRRSLSRRMWLVAAVTALLLVMAAAAKPVLQWMDIHWLDEGVKDAWGALWYSEDWSAAPALPAGLHYQWLHASPRPVLVGHALGDAGLPGQNSMTALQHALDAGLRLLEVDVWLDKAERLRCHHGPNPPDEPRPGECTLAAAAHAVAKADAWLVLDIKTDFKLTSTAIAKQFQTDPSASRLIFQLYEPSDVRHFATLASTMPLPAPIVTAYRSRRSLGHIAGQLNRIGVEVLTVPLYRSEALVGNRPRGLSLLVHPVHDCPAVHLARRAKADGSYLTTGLMSRLGKECT